MFYDDSNCITLNTNGESSVAVDTCMSSSDYYGYFADGQSNSFEVSCSSTLPTVDINEAYLSES